MRRRTQVLLIAGWMVAGVLLGEAGIRVLSLQGDRFYEYDPDCGWAHRKGITGLYRSAEARSDVRINALGLVGPDVSYEKSPGTRRVLLLGDSFTESLQVPYSRSWAAHLEESLGPGWEVLNAGVSGYGTDNALLYLRSAGWKFDPDVVLLLFFTGNDVSDNDYELHRRLGGGQKPYFTLEGSTLELHNHPLPAETSGGLAASVKGVLGRHSRLYLYVRDAVMRQRVLRHQKEATGGEVPLAWNVYKAELDPDFERAWTITGALLDEMQREVVLHGASFVVGILPTGWRVEADERAELVSTYPSLRDTTLWNFASPDERIVAILDAAGISHVNLVDALLTARARTDEPLYGDHLTERGHEVVGRELGRHVRSRLVADTADSLGGGR